MRTTRSTAWRALLPAGVVVLVLVVLAAPANHRWQGTALTRDTSDLDGAHPFVTVGVQATATASRAQYVHPVHVPGWIPWALATAAGLLFALLVALAVRAVWPLVRELVRRQRRRPAPMLPGSELDPQLGGYAETLRRRVDEAAATLLADRRTGGDPVIACWLALEDAAAESGTVRQPWQTPSEFTADLLVGEHADPDACARLLRLYQRARFGHEALTAADTAAAADALAGIARSLDGQRPDAQRPDDQRPERLASAAGSGEAR